MNKKSDFPIFESYPDLVYLDSAATTQKPTHVIDAISNYYSSEYGTVHRGVYELSVASTRRYNAARTAIQSFINAPSSRNVVFTTGTTHSINLVAFGYACHHVKEGDEILITEVEHHANIVPWQQVAQRKGAHLKFVPVTDSGEIDIDVFSSLITKKTKLIAMAHISNVLGSIFPVHEITAIAKENGIPVLIDGAQAIAHEPIDMVTLDPDFYCFSGHKLYGPTGIGVCYISDRMLDKMQPILFGGDMIETVKKEQTTFAPAPLRFEAGTPPIAQVIGLHAAVDFMQSLDFNAVKEKESHLVELVIGELRSIKNVRIIGNAKQRSSAVSFTIDGIHPHDIGSILDSENIAIRVGHHCSQPTMIRYGVPATARVSFGVYNNEDDVHAFLRALQGVLEVFG